MVLIEKLKRFYIKKAGFVGNVKFRMLIYKKSGICGKIH
ncbi:hypothetical protein OGG_03549 [Enterococcus faecium EnGen0013]|nr:hypothetical protein OGG_03549 [Enterococcus faecium EnGen0013]EOF93739.1 hypothetical protein SKG_01156 [Enterococcus faecium EnGen0166]